MVEPSSAAIAHIYHYDVKKYGEFNKLFLTFDFGGGTLDVSVLKCTRLVCEVFAVAGNSTLGGIDFDTVIGNMLKVKVKEDFGWKISPQLEAQIAAKTESIKKTLSEDLSAIVRLENDGYKEVTITRDDFEKESEPLMDAAIQTLNRALQDPRFEDEKSGAYNIRAVKLYSMQKAQSSLSLILLFVVQVLMIGGSCKMPMVRKRLQREFNEYRERIQNEIRDQIAMEKLMNLDANYEVRPIKLILFGEDPSPQQKDENVIFFPNEDAQLMVVKGSAVLGGALAFSNDINHITEADLTQFGNQGAEPSIVDVLPMNLGIQSFLIPTIYIA